MDMLLLAVKAHLNPPKTRQVVIEDCLQSRTCLNRQLLKCLEMRFR